MSDSTPSAAVAKVMTAEQAMYIARRRPITPGGQALVDDALRVLSREYGGDVRSIECDVQRKLTAEELAVVAETVAPVEPAPAAKAAIRIPALAKVAARLEAMMDACRPLRDSDDILDVRLALGSLLLSGHDVLDSLAAIGGRASLEDLADAATAVRMDRLVGELASKLPPVRGGGDPDDFETIDPDFEADPASWPAWTDEGVWMTTEPTPVEVLARSAPTWEPSDADWADYAAYRDGEVTYSPATLDEMVLTGHGHLAAR